MANATALLVKKNPEECHLSIEENDTKRERIILYCTIGKSDGGYYISTFSFLFLTGVNEIIRKSIMS